MLGKANEIKSITVCEGNEPFQKTLQDELKGLGNAVIISITPYFHRDNSIGYTWTNALVIYKEESS